MNNNRLTDLLEELLNAAADKPLRHEVDTSGKMYKDLSKFKGAVVGDCGVYMAGTKDVIVEKALMVPYACPVCDKTHILIHMGSGNDMMFTCDAGDDMAKFVEGVKSPDNLSKAAN